MSITGVLQVDSVTEIRDAEFEGLSRPEARETASDLPSLKLGLGRCCTGTNMNETNMCKTSS